MQVVPSIAMIETYVRMLLLAPHALFRSHLSVISFPLLFGYYFCMVIIFLVLFVIAISLLVRVRVRVKSVGKED